MRAAAFPIALLRMIVFIFSTFIGRLIVGLLLLAGGIAYGTGSHNVVYQWVQRQGPANIIYGNEQQGEDYYYNIPGTNAYYDIHAADFSPYPLPETFKDETAMLQIEKDSTGAVSNTLNDGTTFSGMGYKVVHFILVDTHGRQDFTTQEYRDHPESYYDNHWLIGDIAIALGLLLIAISSLLFILFKESENSRVSSGKSFVSLDSNPGPTWSNGYLPGWKSPRFHNPATPNDLAK